MTQIFIGAKRGEPCSLASSSHTTTPPGARRALEVTLDLSRPCPGVELVAQLLGAHLPHYGATLGEYEEERAFEARRCQHWLETANAIAAQSGVALRTEILAVHPAQELLQVAERHPVDLVIPGHSVYSGVWGRFLGSAVENVSRHANCSVTGRGPQTRPQQPRVTVHVNVAAAL